MEFKSNKQALIDKLRSNYEASRKKLLNESVEFLIANSEDNAAERQVFNTLLEYPFSTDDVNYLLQFNHPLSVVSDEAWRQSHGIFEDDLYETITSAYSLEQDGRTEKPGDETALREKLQENMQFLSAEWQALSPEALIDRAEQIYIPRLIFEAFQDYKADADEVRAMMESERPLDVLSEEWRRRNPGVFAKAVKNVMENVVGNPDNYNDYELDELYAGRGEGGAFAGASIETAAPKQDEQEEKQ